MTRTLETPRHSSKLRKAIPVAIIATGFLLAFGTNISQRIKRVMQSRENDNVPTLISPDTSQVSPPIGPNMGPNPNSPKKFEPQTYSPPAEGEIVDQHIVANSPQTIIYITDEHPMPGASNESNASSRLTQELIIRIVQDLIQKYGPIRLVGEESFIGISAKRLQDLSHTGDPGMDCLGKIARSRNQQARENQLETCLDTTATLAAPALIATYPQTIDPIGSKTFPEIQQTLTLTEDYALATSILTAPADFTCPADDQQTVATTIQAFQQGNRSPEVVTCYCPLQTDTTAAIQGFEHDRAIISTEKEIGAALAAVPANGITVVIAGPNHLAHSRELLRDQGVSYLVVAPNNIIESTTSRLETPIFEELPMLSDDATGTCAAEFARQQAEAEEAFKQWFMEE